MPRTISWPVLLNEFETAVAILKKWQDAITKIADNPEAEATIAPEMMESRLAEMVGELQVVSGKCDVIAEVVSGSLR
jgi:hypothetical protein